jgi:sRNA-binding carbon storage regulator CsrA
MPHLILSRAPDEYIVLRVGGVEIRVTMLGFDNGKRRARLAFEAPRNVLIWRGEVLEKAQAVADETSAPQDATSEPSGS